MPNLLRWRRFYNFEGRWYSVQRSLIDDTDSINSPHEYELSNGKLKKTIISKPNSGQFSLPENKGFLRCFSEKFNFYTYTFVYPDL